MINKNNKNSFQPMQALTVPLMLQPHAFACEQAPRQGLRLHHHPIGITSPEKQKHRLLSQSKKQRLPFTITCNDFCYLDLQVPSVNMLLCL